MESSKQLNWSSQVEIIFLHDRIVVICNQLIALTAEKKLKIYILTIKTYLIFMYARIKTLHLLLVVIK